MWLDTCQVYTAPTIGAVLTDPCVCGHSGLGSSAEVFTWGGGHSSAADYFPEPSLNLP